MTCEEGEWWEEWCWMWADILGDYRGLCQACLDNYGTREADLIVACGECEASVDLIYNFCRMKT